MSAKASSSKHASKDQEVKKRKEKKSKGTETPAEIAEAAEDVDMLGRPSTGFERAHPGHPDWAQRPRANAQPMPLDFEVEYGEFDYDEIKKDPDVELWLVRVPKKLKPKRLAGATIRTPAQAAEHGGHAGYIEDKKERYNVWMVDRDRNEEDVKRDQRLPGEEMFGMDVLLPRQKKGGKLYQAPKPITRHLVISASPAQPDALKTEEGEEETVYKNEPRQNYPVEMLKHRFLPTGSESARPLPGSSKAPMTLEDDEKEDEIVEEVKEKSKKKRKGHAVEGGERKSKKAKTTRAE